MSGTRGRRVVTCGRCGRNRVHVAKGKCGTCYRNSLRVYVPTGTGRGGRGVPRSADVIADRVADYAELRSLGYSVQRAAERLGVADRTAWRYEARLRAGVTVEALYDSLPGGAA